MDKLINLLKESKHCVVFTGAGVSTLAGIQDFRGKDGIYKTAGEDAEKIFDIDYFHKKPSFYYKAAKDFIYNLDQKKPAIVHTEDLVKARGSRAERGRGLAWARGYNV